MARGLPLLIVIALGCGSEGRLLVDVRTDMVPGVELDEVVTVVTSPVRPPVSRPVSVGEDWLAGVRVADIDPVSGEVALTVRGLRLGRVVVERPVLVRVSGRRAVTVTLSRDCRDVRCPGPDDPSAVACRGGRCVDPSCTEDRSDPACAPDCALDADCGSVDGCATPRCLDGVCLQEADDSACDAGAVCIPGEGCRAAAGDILLGLPGFFLGQDVGITSDGGSYVYGATMSEGRIALIDGDGELRWSRRLSSSPGFTGRMAMSGDDAILSGSAGGGPDFDIGIAGVTAVGEERFAIALRGSPHQVARAIAVAADGDVVVAGSESGTAPERDVFVARYSPDEGALRWARRYGGTVEGDQFADGVAVTEDAIYVAATTAFSLSPDQRTWVLRLDPLDGSVVWTRLVGPANSQAVDVVALPEGGALVCGYSLGESLVLTRLGPDGESIFHRAWVGVGLAPTSRLVELGDVLAVVGNDADASELLLVDGPVMTSGGRLRDSGSGLSGLAVYADGTLSMLTVSVDGAVQWGRLGPGGGSCAAWTRSEVRATAVDVDDVEDVLPGRRRDEEILDLVVEPVTVVSEQSLVPTRVCPP